MEAVHMRRTAMNIFLRKTKKNHFIFQNHHHVSSLLNLDWQTAVSNSHTDCLHGPRLNLSMVIWPDRIWLSQDDGGDDTVMSHLSCSSLKASDLLLVYDNKHSKMFFHRDDGENAKILCLGDKTAICCASLYTWHMDRFCFPTHLKLQPNTVLH